MRQAAAGQRQHLHRIVERSGIAAARLDHREDFLDIVAELIGRQHGFARVHPVHVAAHRIDLAVVADVAVRMGELPGGKSIGRETLVHHAQRAARLRIGKLAVKIRDLRREQQSLIHDGARRHGRDVEKRLLADIARGDLGFGPAADDVQLPFELILRHGACPWARRRKTCSM